MDAREREMLRILIDLQLKRLDHLKDQIEGMKKLVIDLQMEHNVLRRMWEDAGH
jgi:hypothetical protein